MIDGITDPRSPWTLFAEGAKTLDPTSKMDFMYLGQDFGSKTADLPYVSEEALEDLATATEALVAINFDPADILAGIAHGHAAHFTDGFPDISVSPDREPVVSSGQKIGKAFALGDPFLARYIINTESPPSPTAAYFGEYIVTAFWGSFRRHMTVAADTIRKESPKTYREVLPHAIASTLLPMVAYQRDISNLLMPYFDEEQAAEENGQNDPVVPDATWELHEAVVMEEVQKLEDAESPVVTSDLEHVEALTVRHRLPRHGRPFLTLTEFGRAQTVDRIRTASIK